jgi:hypothetical protein
MKKMMMALLGGAAASLASAGDGAQTGGLSLLEYVFIAFGALILLAQFFPAILLFGSMIYGLFTSELPGRRRGRELTEKS